VKLEGLIADQHPGVGFSFVQHGIRSLARGRQKYFLEIPAGARKCFSVTNKVMLLQSSELNIHILVKKNYLRISMVSSLSSEVVL
jgi:hypothetical protein